MAPAVALGPVQALTGSGTVTNEMMKVMRVTPSNTGIRSNALLAMKLAMPVCSSLTFGSDPQYLAVFRQSESIAHTGT
jgi:hypothetical protein